MSEVKLKTPTKKSLSVEGFFSVLLMASVHTHVLHLQTKSYAVHKALQEFYETLPGLVDGLIEAYQGTNGIVQKYEFNNISLTEPVSYLKSFYSKLTEAETLFTDSDLKNQLDEIKTLAKSTLYKLQNLS